MSDFVARLAARAAGQEPARPQLRTVVEWLDRSDEPEVVDGTVVAPVANTALEGPPRAARAPAAAPALQARVPHTAPRVPAAAQPLPAATAPWALRPAPVASDDRPQAPSSPATAEPAGAALVRARGPAAARSTDQAATVRIHIGRLEVRANLQAPAAQARAVNAPPARREPGAETALPLADYLRGRREVR